MAKTQIKRLKAERFWRWLVVHVHGNTKAAEYYAKHPIKQDRRGLKLRPRERRWLLNSARINRVIDDIFRKLPPCKQESSSVASTADVSGTPSSGLVTTQ